MPDAKEVCSRRFDKYPDILADFSVGPHSRQPGTFPCISKLNVIEIEDAKQIQEVVPVEN